MDFIKRTLSSFAAPLLLLAVCLLTYTVLIPGLGFYWDDLPLGWIAEKMGSEGLTRYFSTNRPYWGELFKITTFLLGNQPWQWQAFSLLWRCVSCILFWMVIRLAWKSRPQVALFAALLMAIYPAMPVQFISLMYSHFFITFSIFLASLLFCLLALRPSKWKLLFTGLGMAFSLANLLFMEYYLPLEMIRPFLIWAALDEEKLPLKQRFKKAVIHWLPYLAVLAGAVFWRAFFFQFQNQNYSYVLLERLKASPLQAISELFVKIAVDLWTVTFAAWGLALQVPDATTLGQRTTLAWGLLSATITVGIFAALYLMDRRSATKPAAKGGLPLALFIALVALILGGVPFWLIDLAVNLRFPNVRVTVSFLVGIGLMLGALLAWMPGPHWLRRGLLALLVGLGAGYQLQTATVFRRDWTIQTNLLWQLSWRIPNLQPDTALLINDLPLHYSTDNSMTGAVNWVFGQDEDGVHTNIPYMLYYPTLRLGFGLPSLEKGNPISQDYLAGEFHGSTSQVLALSFYPPACLHVLDPEIDPVNETIPPLMRTAAGLTNMTVILPSGPRGPSTPPTDVFGPEPVRGWCYYYEQAELARQMGDWNKVVELAGTAFSLNDHPNDPIERFPFIEGYAMRGDWTKALEFSTQTADITTRVRPSLCRLWQRIGRNAKESPEKEASIRQVNESLGCSPQ